jgi:hypothetical protein
VAAARVLECLQWYRRRLPDYEPSRGALECAAIFEAVEI